MEKIVANIKNMLHKAKAEKCFYISKLASAEKIIIISLIMAAVCTFISYPGMMYIDSYSRITFVSVLKEQIIRLMSNNKQVTFSWATVTPSYFIALCIELTGNVAFYTFCQAFAFYFMSFLVMRKIGGGYRFIQYIFFALSPLFYCAGVYCEAGIGSVTGIMALFLILRTNDNFNSISDKVITLLLTSFFSFITIGFRANAVTVFPIIILLVLVKKICVKYKIIFVTAVVSGIFFAAFIPRALMIDTMSSATAGYVWETIMTIKNMDNGKQGKYMDYFDDLAGAGSTASAVNDTNEDLEWNICPMFYDGLNPVVLSQKGASEKILAKYFGMLKNEPMDWLRTRLHFAGRTLGINKELVLYEWFYDRDNNMKNYNFNNSEARYKFFLAYEAAVNMSPLCKRPIILFIVGLILILVHFRDRKNIKHFGDNVFLFLLAVFYYGAFVLNNQSFEFRYYYPSFHLLLMLCAAMLLNKTEIILKNSQMKKKSVKE